MNRGTPRLSIGRLANAVLRTGRSRQPLHMHDADRQYPVGLIAFLRPAIRPGRRRLTLAKRCSRRSGPPTHIASSAAVPRSAASQSYDAVVTDP